MSKTRQQGGHGLKIKMKKKKKKKGEVDGGDDDNKLDILTFGGLEVACWLLVPKFAGSNPAEAVGFLRAKKSSARLPSEGK